MTNEIKIQNPAMSAPKKKHRGASLNERKARMGWLFILPFVLGLVFIYAGVIYESFIYSFAQYNTIPAIRGGGYSLTWVGFDNFVTQLVETTVDDEGKTFLEMMFTSFGQKVLGVVIIIMFSLFIAVLLNQKMIGRTAFRAIFFVPVVVSAGIIARIDNTASAIMDSMASMDGIDLGEANGGGLNALVNMMDFQMMFQNLGIGSQFITIITNLVSNIYDIVSRSGVQMLIFLAGLQSISPSIYESCQMEGATGWETFWKITFPMISPMILANSIYTVIDSFTAESNEVMQAILDISPNGVPNGQQSAAAWTYFTLVILSLGIVALILRKFVFYQRRND